MRRVLKILNDMVSDGVIRDYAIGGASALLYFSKPTFTEDIDVFIYPVSPPVMIVDLSSIYKYLTTTKKAVIKGEHLVLEGFPVQFLLPYDDLSREAFERAVRVKLENVSFKIFDLEHLMAIMIQLGKAKYLERLRVLMLDRTFDEKKLSAILSRFHLVRKWTKMKKVLHDASAKT